MINHSLDDLFDAVFEYPNLDFQDQYSSLVGLGNEKNRILKESRLFLRPHEVGDWSKRHYGCIVPLVSYFRGRTPLFVFAGDVGTGKTSLAESFPDSVARDLKIAVTLFRLSLGARGTGMVGQMTSLLTNAFRRIEEEAGKFGSNGPNPSGAIVLLIDEADALAQSRAISQMHHEDRAGVNALIRGIDRISTGNHPVLVVLCTNRLEALDPAIVRRAADIFTFERPNLEQITAVMNAGLTGLGFSCDQIRTLARLLSYSNGREYGCTYSDLARKFLPGVLFSSFPESPIDFERARELAQSFVPTPPFGNGETI